ncbi:MAG: transporter substrate-binding domain-containing protein, partial [Oscillospiraceae bacterium]|nr:transporter substrate-binding domain-containing protein [Oscillospiraceae bacterium]
MKKMLVIGLALVLAVSLFPFGVFAGGISGASDLSQQGIRIGVGSGTVQEQLVAELFPEAELLYYDRLNGYAAVAQGKIDANIYDKKQMELAVTNGLQGVRILDQTLGEPTRIAVGISKMSPIPNLEKQVNRFILQLKQDGTLGDMYDRWVNRGDFQMPEIAGAASPQYHLVVGTTGDVEPYSFFEGSTVTGYDIELAYRFAAWLGADVEFQIFNWDGIVPAVQAGKADLIASNLQVTPERAEELLFSDTLYEEENGIMVRDTGASANAQASGQVRWQNYNGKRLGVLVGPLMEDTAAEFFPDSEYLLFNSYPDCAAALLAGKIDGFLGDEPGMISRHAENPEIDYIHESLTENNYAFAFRKDDPESASLCAELNAFLAKSWADGTMEEIENIWLGVDEDRKDVDMSGLTGENGTIKVVTTSSDMPWSYIKDGKNVGYDIDLVVRFCRERGYALELGDVDFAGRIPAVQSGKYDFTTDMNVTPEREEQVLFSDPTAHGGIVLAVLASDLAPAASGVVNGVYQSLDELAGKRIGVITGSIHDGLVAERLPTAQRVYFTVPSDMLAALKAGKIDAFVLPEASAIFMRYEDGSITWLDESLQDGDVGFAFPKTEEGRLLCGRFSEYIRAIQADGTLAELTDKWFRADESVKTMIDYTALPATNGTLRMATAGIQVPFNYVRDNTIVG